MAISRIATSSDSFSVAIPHRPSEGSQSWIKQECAMYRESNSAYVADLLAIFACRIIWSDCHVKEQLKRRIPVDDRLIQREVSA